MTIERFETRRRRWLAEAYVRHDIELRRQLERERSETGTRLYPRAYAKRGSKHEPSPTAAGDIGGDLD